MGEPLTITTVKRPARDFTLKTVPTGGVVQFDNGNIGLIVQKYVVILTDYIGNIDPAVIKKITIDNEDTKYLGQLTGITVQEK